MYIHSKCDFNEKVVVGYLHAFSSKLNDSLILSVNMKYIESVDKKQVSEYFYVLSGIVEITRPIKDTNSL